jgi:hypothetical protein
MIEQMNGFSYERLAFHMADSRCLRAFCGFGIDEKSPRKSALQQNIKRIQPETLELVNRHVLEGARVRQPHQAGHEKVPWYSEREDEEEAQTALPEAA